MKSWILPSRLFVFVFLLAHADLAWSEQTVAPPAKVTFRERYLQAQTLYNEQAYAEAIVALRGAYALKPEPGLLLNLGHAHQKLGHHEQAIDYYQQYLAASPQLSASARQDVTRYIENARKLIELVRAQQSPSLVQLASQGRLVLLPAVPAPEPPRPVKPRPPRGPLQRQWWFWGTLGVVAVGVTAGVIAATKPWDRVPTDIPIDAARPQ